MTSSLTPEETWVIQLADRSIWSDEVEMLARLHATILSKLSKSPVNWKKLLPDRFVHEATVATAPDGEEMKQITRGLSKMLDAFAASFTKKP